LVDGDEEKILAVVEDVFGTITVVGVEIPDGDPADAALARGKCGDGDLVEITKSHGLRGQSVVSGWTHQSEGFLFFVQRSLHCGKRCSNGAACVCINAIEVRGVVVEIVSVLEPFQMLG